MVINLVSLIFLPPQECLTLVTFKGKQEEVKSGTIMDGYFLDLTRRIERIRLGDTPIGMLQELKSRDFWRAVFAEFIATMVFLFIATMAAVPLVPVDGVQANIIKVGEIFLIQ